MIELRYAPILLLFLTLHVVSAQVAAIGNNNCTTGEPWGRYSASGGLYQTTEEGTVQSYLYSFGGDTSSIADSSGGGVVRTNFRFDLATGCWERLADSPVAIGYRATAILLQEDSFYVFGGSNAQFQALNHMYRYSIGDNTWTEVLAAVADSSEWPPARWRHTAVKLSDTTMLIHGGRQGRTVLSDAWIFDAELSQWTMVSTDIGVAAYRHGMAYDSQRDIVWLHGGIDADFQRHAKLYRWEWASSGRVVEVLGTTVGDEKPTRRASHALDFVQELDALVLYGGTCGDEGQAYLYNISTGQWCSIEAEQQPSLRDAMLWAVQYPNFYVYGGDLICIEVGQVYSIADVHVLDLTASSSTWENIYVPNNQRASDLTELCDGTNSGSCRAPPLLEDVSTSDWSSVCQRSDNNPASGVTESEATPTISPGLSTAVPASGAAIHWRSINCLLVPVSAWLLIKSLASWTYR